MNKSGFIKRLKFGLSRLPFAAGILCGVYALVGIITGAVGMTKEQKKADKIISEYSMTEEFNERSLEDKAKNEEAYLAGKIDEDQYNKNATYFNSEDYKKDLLKSESNSEYNAVLKSHYIYSAVTYSAIASTALCASGVFGGKLLMEYYDDYGDYYI